MMVIRSSLRRPGVRFSPTRAKTLAHFAIPSGITTPPVRRPEISEFSTSGIFRGSTECPPSFIPSCGLLRGPHACLRAQENSERRGQSPLDLPERDSRGMAKCDFMTAAIPFRSMPPSGGEGAFRNFDRAVASISPKSRDTRPSTAFSNRESLCAARGKTVRIQAPALVMPGARIPKPSIRIPMSAPPGRRRAEIGDPATRSGRDAPRDGTGVRRDHASRPSRHRNRDAEEVELASLPHRCRTNEARCEPMSRGSATAWGRHIARRGVDRMTVSSRSEPLSATSDGQSMLLRFGRGSALR